jgi:SAM-dependent methyltransferase
LCKYLKPGSKVLDAGCGAGIVALDAVQRGFYVIGIDISEKMINLCEKNFSQSGIPRSKYLFKVGNVIDNDLADSSFDGVLALGFLEYQENEKKALESLRRVLRQRGILVCSGPTKTRITNIFGLGLLLEDAWPKAFIRNPHMINMYSLSRFNKLLESSGFTLIDYERHGYADFYPIIWLYRLLHIDVIGARGKLFLHHALTRISRVFPIDTFANDIIVVARKN